MPLPAQRPLRTKNGDELAAEFDRALAAGDGLAGAHCIHERWMRGEFAAHIEAARDLLWKRAAATIPDWLPMTYVSWLPAAYDVAAQFTAKASGRSNIYLVLLDFSDRRGDDHGVYVGMSRYSPSARPRAVLRSFSIPARTEVRGSRPGGPGAPRRSPAVTTVGATIQKGNASRFNSRK